MEFRYENIKLKHMQKIRIKNNYDKKPVIYVEECSKFKRREWKNREKIKTT